MSNRVRLVGTLLALLIAWLYVYRLTYQPPRWEEPRRLVVAFEMIYNGDYVVPTVIGELYGKKPPLQNWLIVLLSGFEVRNISVQWVRVISVLSMLACAAMLALLAGPTQKARWPWLPGIMLLTMGIVVQYGRSGEIDPLFVFWTTGALFFYELGRRRGEAWLRWIPSQIMVAGGILTKGIAPMFFYPPVLLWALSERRRASAAGLTQGRMPWLAVSGGLLTMVAIVAGWLLPYAWSGSLGQLTATFSQEVSSRTPLSAGVGRVLQHLITFPFEVFGNLLPWSLLGFGLFWRSPRQAFVDLWREQPYLRLLVVTFAWGAALMWLMPESRGRYAMPAYPFAAAAIALVVERWISGIGATQSEGLKLAWRSLPLIILGGLAVSWSAYAVVASSARDDVHLAVPLGIGLVALGLVGYGEVHRLGPPRAVRWLLVFGFLYGAAYVSVHESRHAARDSKRVDATRSLAHDMKSDARLRQIDTSDMPVACGRQLSMAVCYEMMKALGRPLQRPPLPAGDPGYLFMRSSEPAPSGAELVSEREQMRVWRL